MAPSRGIKPWVTEGGIRCPCLIHYPLFGAQPNAISQSLTTVMDIQSTILDLAGLKHSGDTFRNRRVHLPTGMSWVSHLSSPDYTRSTVHDRDTQIHGWEFLSQQAIRQGDWKAIWMPAPRGKDTWELFNIKKTLGSCMIGRVSRKSCSPR